MVVFVSSFEGKSKTTGNPFQVVSLLEARVSRKGEAIVGRVVEFFVSDIDCSELQAGDVVKPEFEESEFLGGKPDLVALEPTGENVFAEILGV